MVFSSSQGRRRLSDATREGLSLGTPCTPSTHRSFTAPGGTVRDLGLETGQCLADRLKETPKPVKIRRQRELVAPFPFGDGALVEACTLGKLLLGEAGRTTEVSQCLGEGPSRAEWLIAQEVVDGW